MANANPATKGTPQVIKAAPVATAPAVVDVAAVASDAVIEAAVIEAVNAAAVAAFTIEASTELSVAQADKPLPKNAIVTDTGKGFTVTTFA